MDEQKFWAIVQRSHDASGGDMEKKSAVITAEISRLTRDEALGFSRLFNSMMDKAYSWKLWGAAYVIHGGCGDNSFSDFRASLISRGRATFDQALNDPDFSPTKTWARTNGFSKAINTRSPMA